MNWLSGFNGRVEANAPLAGLTWFNVGGAARWLTSPANTKELGEVVRRAAENQVNLKVLGGGANVLVHDDGFDGVVVRLDEPQFVTMAFNAQGVEAGAGVDLMRLAYSCTRRGLTGMEGLAGIPGSIGGSVRMNAGGRYGQIGDAVEAVGVVDEEGCVKSLSREEVGFGYRTTDLGSGIVVSATIRVVQGDRESILERFRSIWAEKKRTQPLAARSAGCVFKNPNGVSAGALIDRSGLKGLTCGGASVSDKHANFIVTHPNATSSDVLALMDRMRQVVLREFGVELELEVDVW